METNIFSTNLLYELNFHTPWTWMHFAEDMVCVGGLMAEGYRVEVGVSGTRQVRGSYKEENSIIFNSLLVSPLKKTSLYLNI